MSARPAATIYMPKSLSNWLAVGLLLVLFFQLLSSSVTESPTFDEIVHATRGYVFLSTRDWRMQVNLHPPLIHLITGLFMWPVFPHVDPRALDSWVSSSSHFTLALDLVDAMGYPSAFVPIFGGRIVAMGFTLVLGAFLFRWARSWYGAAAGLLALGVYTFDPNILANGRLITTDIPVVMTFFLTAYALQRFVARPTYKALVLAGLALGLALAAKISAVIILPLFAMMVMPWTQNPDWLRPLRLERGERSPLRLPIVWLLGTGLIALCTVWAIYAFEVGPYAAGWPALPLPTYVRTLATTFGSFYQEATAPAAFLMGARSLSGWWYYFPVTLLLKTPLPLLIGSLLGLAWLLKKKMWWQLWFGALLPVAYTAVAMLNSWNLGYRHILPVVPFLALGVAPALHVFHSRRLLRVVGCALLIWLLVGTVRVYPHYLAYFNELAGGPANGHRLLTDSNLDWGQGLIQLRAYLEETEPRQVYLSYFGSVDPATYDIEFVPLSSFFPLDDSQPFPMYSPDPGIYAISVTNLSGQYLPNPSEFDWFRRQTPIAHIGYSIHIYSVPPLSTEVPRVVGVCRGLQHSETPAEWGAGFGQPEVRLIYLDCDAAIPALDSLGWVVVSPQNESMTLFLESSNWQLVFQQTDFEGDPWFNVYLGPTQR